jgi:mono/diheme cytochrome c family protein
VPRQAQRTERSSARLQALGRGAPESSAFAKRRSQVIIMRRLREGQNTGSNILRTFVLICFAVAGLHATPQATPKTPEKAKEQLEQLIYSVKGLDLFRAHCAACHGSDANGNGPLASMLKAKAADLTVLAKNNGGEFPSARVRKTITGEDVLASHGSREMPIWGPIFHQIESDQDFGNVRVQNLVKYLESIQQK